MIVLYQEKGYTLAQSKAVCDVLSQNPRAFVEIMMVEELGILASPSLKSMFIRSIVIFVAKIVGGMVPYILLSIPWLSDLYARIVFFLIFFAGGMLVSRTAIQGPIVCGLINVAISGTLVLLAEAI